MRRFHLESKLHAFLTGECDDATRREVEQLLKDDAKARALLEEMRDAHEALLLLRERPAPEAPLDDIRRSIAAGVFAGKPEPVMAAWGTQFYKRVAAAAVLVCGVSLGVLAHQSFRAVPGTGPGAPESPAAAVTVGGDEATETARAARDREMAARDRTAVGGALNAYELMRKNKGNLVTFTPTDSVVPAFEVRGDVADGTSSGR